MKQPSVSIVIPTHNRKEMLIRLINSIMASNYPKDKKEIIVVDDASSDGTFKEIKGKFREVKVIRNEKNLFAAGSRNIGMRSAKGDYIFLVDDDNVIDKECISELVKTFNDGQSRRIGVAAPFSYYLEKPNYIWLAGMKTTKLTMFTSSTAPVGIGQRDCGQFNELVDSLFAPNAFMIRRELIEKVGLFDERFPIYYDDKDYGERTRKVGYRIIYNPKAKVWHDTPFPKEENKIALVSYAIDHYDEPRIYYFARGRVLFNKKYSNPWRLLLFILIFNWLFTVYYTAIILFGSKKPFIERLKIARNYLKGVLDGVALSLNIH